MRLSLRYRLLLPPAVLLAGVAGATAWAASAAASSAEERIAHQIGGVARTLTEPPAFPLRAGVLEQMKRLSGAEFLLVDRTGGVFSTFPEPPPPPDVPEFGHVPTLGPPVEVAGNEYRCLKLTLGETHPDHGGTLYIFYPDALRRAAVRDAVRPSLWLGAGAGLAAVILALHSSTRLVSRIRSLEQRTRDIAAGRFEPVRLPPADDELRDLGRSINEMARQLAGYQQALAATERLRVLGQFSCGLAHQLRNAATGARLAVELHADECGTADREPLEVALRQLTRIEANLRQFLALGRPPDRVTEPCDLADLLDQAVALLQPQCRHADIVLGWKPRGPTTYRGDPTLLGHLFANVIGNAVEAAGPGGRVDVSLTGNGMHVVEVSDTGPGPPANLAESLFDPFVTGREQGIGLGLAVAKQAAEAHGGRIRWQRRDERTVFSIELPPV
jgi:signal transduction histidine kinase